MEKDLPTQARAVVIGGGIVGCSVAYHLTKLGWTDVVVLEQGRLSGGTTWHAAGLVGQLRSHPNMTSLIRYSTELYGALEAETGLATGWKRCGSLTVARTQDRMIQLRRTAALARAFGVEAEVITPAEAGRKWPVMRTDDLIGAIWLPGDGKANPTDLTQALARGARTGGARIFEKTRVTGIAVENGAAAGVRTEAGDVACEVVVNCAGQWARQVGRLANVTVPLHSCEHMYIVTKEIDGVTPDLPVMRDPDGYVYFKEEVGGLVLGGFEPQAKPWGMDGIPADFEFTLLPDDWDQFEILMENGLIRVPALEHAEVRQFINGPESFTPDNNFILGEAPELRHFFVAAGFNSMGISAAGGAGRALAAWIVEGAPTEDLWPVDIRRFAGFEGDDAFLKDRVSEVLGLHYMMPWPLRELEKARPVRRSPVYDRLRAKGACFGSKMGWERANWFATGGAPARMEYSWGRGTWFDRAAEEHRAAREAVAVFDQTSFSKFLLHGGDAEDVVQRLCANDMAVEPGRVVYTGLLNERGGYESDLTVTRLSGDTYFIVSGSAQTTRDLDWIRRSIPPEARASLTDVTSDYAVFGVMGPSARALLTGVAGADLGNEAFPFATMRDIGIGRAPVRALRVTYVGEMGWELYVPVEFAPAVYDDLVRAGRELGLRDAGYYALDSLRLEKGYRAWGRDIGPDWTPLEAGLAFAVRLDKPFTGREALVRQRQQGLTQRLVQFVLTDPEPLLFGGELILRDGQSVGEVTSAAYGHTLGRSVALGWVRNAGGVDRAYIGAGTYELDVGGERFAATAHLESPYDPKGARMRA
ncbi:MAG: FAD-dependent oxidoreductase [Alphaproteobacteria bacterium]|nr:FAD-dependent oxidoreductase [Alphaproteobacteria bacterium]